MKAHCAWGYLFGFKAGALMVTEPQSRFEAASCLAAACLVAVAVSRQTVLPAALSVPVLPPVETCPVVAIGGRQWRVASKNKTAVAARQVSASRPVSRLADLIGAAGPGLRAELGMPVM